MTFCPTLSFHQVGDGMLIIDPTSADFLDDDDENLRGGRGGGRDSLTKRKKGGKGGKGLKKDGTEKGGKKKKEDADGKGGKKKKGDGEGDGKGKKGKKGDKDDKRKGKKSDGGMDKEGKGGKGRRTPQDDSAVAADERKEEERKRREAEDREEEKERQRRAREMKMAMEAELAAEKEREAAEKKANEDDLLGDRRINRNRLYANEDEALEAEMNALRRKAKMANRGSASGRSDLSRSSSDAEGRLADSRAELAEKRRRELDERLTWMTSHLGLSRQSCRFELPMDMRLLETMTPREYLSKYCVISSKRMLLYKRVFGKFVSKAHKTELVYEDVAAALREVHIHGISEDQMNSIMRLVDVEGLLEGAPDAEGERKDNPAEREREAALNKNVDFNFFAGIAALTERILYPIHANSMQMSKQYDANEEEPLPDNQPSAHFGKKEKLERADFFCMPWKFDGINVNPSVKRLLEVL